MYGNKGNVTSLAEIISKEMSMMMVMQTEQTSAASQAAQQQQQTASMSALQTQASSSTPSSSSPSNLSLPCTSADDSASASNSGPKRLHISNIPFRFREQDLRTLLEVTAHTWFGFLVVFFTLRTRGSLTRYCRRGLNFCVVQD